MLWILRWLILFGAHAQDVRDLSDRFAPPGWQGNPWGPAATRARAEGRLPLDRDDSRDDAMGPVGAGGAP